jgi:uncharacterized repeat protein (TIGR03843 family)
VPKDKRPPRPGSLSGRQAAKDAAQQRSTPAQADVRLPEDTDHVLTVLSCGEIELKGRLRWSSNATFLVAVHPPKVKRRDAEVVGREPENDGRPSLPRQSLPGQPLPRPSLARQSLLAIYKPVKGERPLWDFPRGLWRREVAAYQLACSLGWDLVPPTVSRPDAPLGPGSLQFCVDAVLEEHYFTLLDEPRRHQSLRRIAVFDLVANNADRKSGHCLLDRGDHIWGIDNALCFHSEPKLRTVIWDFVGEQIDDELLASLEPLSQAVVPVGLAGLLEEEEIEALSARAAAVSKLGRYPQPSGDYPYPWPLV